MQYKVNTKYLKLLTLNKVLILLICLLCFKSNIKSQDITGAFFQQKLVSGYKYSGDLYMFTNLSNTIFRPYVLFNWGPSTDTLWFVQANAFANTVVNKFTGTFTYANPGFYQTIFIDAYRISGIKNISNSQNETIQIANTISINSFSGSNDSPTLQNYPIYYTKMGNQVFYDPNFTDDDGDSLSFSITNCSAANYYLPSGVALNPFGVLTFSKDSIGLYAFSYNIHEWRKNVDGNYVYLGSTQFDFVMDINSSIGIEELKWKNKIILAPNPASTILHIKSELNFNEETKIEITNSLGQVVLNINYSAEIDISLLNSGIYFIKVITPNKQQFHCKFLKVE